MADIARIGIVGCGNITATMHLPILANIHEARVEYLADLHPPKELASDFGTHAIAVDDIAALPDCDIMLLATPVGVRERYIEEFGKRATILFTEKPFAINEQQHLRFLSVATHASCNYMRTTYSSIAQLKGIVVTRLFGALRRVTITDGGIARATGMSATHYQMDLKLSGGGVLMESGCHTLSQLTYLLDGYRFEVTGAQIKWLDQLDVDVETSIKGYADSAVEISYHASRIRPVTNSMTFEFDTACVCFDPGDPASRLLITSNDGSFRHLMAPDKTHPLTFIQAFFAKWSVVLDAWAGRSRIDSASETSLQTTRLIEAIYATAGRSSV